MKLILALLTLGIILSSCDSENKEEKENKKDTPKGWTKEQRSQFANDCFNEVKLAAFEEDLLNFCDCFAENAEKDHAEYIEFNKLSSDEMAKYGDACMDLIPKQEASEWTEEDTQLFMKDCMSSATGNFPSEEGAQEYCDCYFEKIKILFSTFEESQNITEDQALNVSEECLTEVFY